MLIRILNLTIFFHIAFVSSLDVYWNIPTFMCKKYLNFTGLQSLYGIYQNEGDSFRGSVISIMYKNGEFPELQQDKSGISIAKNGGVPQEGNLTAHLKKFEEHVDSQIPDRSFNGLAVIDFETWRPVFRQNFGSHVKYKTFSINLEKEKHPSWNPKEIEAEASRKFEESARAFVEETMRVARQLRPKATWGYYAFPYCINNGGEDSCSKLVMEENERTNWMYKNAQMILPSTYLYENVTPEGRKNLVIGRVKEAMRISNTVGKLPVYVYIRYVYGDSKELLTKIDMENVFKVAEDQGAKGIILWGSSSDLTSNKTCMDFDKYVKEVIGPLAKSYQYSDSDDNSYYILILILCASIAVIGVLLKCTVFRNRSEKC